MMLLSLSIVLIAVRYKVNGQRLDQAALLVELKVENLISRNAVGMAIQQKYRSES